CARDTFGSGFDFW
nr:immunoglobulin heavy chain junction region [Macaca mulatta]